MSYRNPGYKGPTAEQSKSVASRVADVLKNKLNTFQEAQKKAQENRNAIDVQNIDQYGKFIQKEGNENNLSEKFDAPIRNIIEVAGEAELQLKSENDPEKRKFWLNRKMNAVKALKDIEAFYKNAGAQAQMYKEKGGVKNLGTSFGIAGDPNEQMSNNQGLLHLFTYSEGDFGIGYNPDTGVVDFSGKGKLPDGSLWNQDFNISDFNSQDDLIQEIDGWKNTNNIELTNLIYDKKGNLKTDLNYVNEEEGFSGDPSTRVFNEEIINTDTQQTTGTKKVKQKIQIVDMGAIDTLIGTQIGLAYSDFAFNTNTQKNSILNQLDYKLPNGESGTYKDFLTQFTDAEDQEAKLKSLMSTYFSGKVKEGFKSYTDEDGKKIWYKPLAAAVDVGTVQESYEVSTLNGFKASFQDPTFKTMIKLDETKNSSYWTRKDDKWVLNNVVYDKTTGAYLPSEVEGSSLPAILEGDTPAVKAKKWQNFLNANGNKKTKQTTKVEAPI